MDRYSAYELNGLWYIYDIVFHSIIPFSPEFKTQRAFDSRVADLNRWDDQEKIKSLEMDNQQLLALITLLLSQGRSMQVDIRLLPKDSRTNKVTVEGERHNKMRH